MRKITAFLLALFIIITLSACGKVNVPDVIPEKGAGISGEWEVLKAEPEKSKNPLNGVLVNVLESEIKKGDTIVFGKDGRGKVGDRDILYELKGERLTLTWDESKNFNFEVSFDDGLMELEMDDVFEMELRRVR